MASPTTQLAAVIGWPVEHSRSPAIHNAAAAASDTDLVYVAWPVESGGAEQAITRMRSIGMRGLSVTMPHKEAVIPGLDELTPVAKLLGAVNHITNHDGHLVGNNTDGQGFLRGLAHATGIDVDGKRVAVFGSGGAARAIVHACATAGAQVVVVARNAERAELARSVGGQNAVLGSIEDLATADIVVNATPVGMAGTDSAGLVPFEVLTLKADATVVDIVYNPLETLLLRQTRDRGLVGVDGLAMLVGQAAEQFETWTGVEPPFAAMVTAAREGLL